jgi:3-isopropylmalate/(R)-2-methylmalate dehydratase small subunit
VIVSGRAVLVQGENIDTDVLYPGARMNVSDPEEMRQYLFEGYDPKLRDQLGGDVALVTGANFGIGSSREHVPQAMQASGIRLVLGPSFARIFKRNCINLGLPIIECQEAATAAAAGDVVSLETDTGKLTVGDREFAAPAVAPLILDLSRKGGLVEWVNQRLRARKGAAT